MDAPWPCLTPPLKSESKSASLTKPTPSRISHSVYHSDPKCRRSTDSESAAFPVICAPQRVVLTSTFILLPYLGRSFPLQGGVDYGLPAPFNGARSPDPTVNHFLRWLPHCCDGGAGQSERCRFIKCSSLISCWSACATRLIIVLIDLAPPVQLVAPLQLGSHG